MSEKNNRKLRKALGVTRENLKTAEYIDINPVTKIVYFRNRNGELVPTKTTRTQRINRNKLYYRRMKKQLSRGL